MEHGMRSEPFAIQLYRRFLKGDTIANISLELGIPSERIEMRIRAAAVYCGTHPVAAIPGAAA
jgi:hypothetical protein